MELTGQNTSEYSPLITSLYTAVDALDAQGVVDHVTDDVQFQLGNFEQISGRKAVKNSNAAFFATIKAMHHSISGVWSSGDTAICDGTVHYTRLDQSEHEVPFAAHLGIRDGKIADYRVFVDISGL
ncbi:nuclear transport factor 2 family protein [uncultured Sulfitobacter sp.]|uniref:nuclear transport factor 2 family protein n=1 Tax=uncultured Sulfitobacter sp. TaxID=191468 RepID=UPI002628D5D0|nr:nuclear transport factor 2 family protein [uncultured Sulfitobacter sp.]